MTKPLDTTDASKYEEEDKTELWLHSRKSLLMLTVAAASLLGVQTFGAYTSSM